MAAVSVKKSIKSWLTEATHKLQYDKKTFYQI